jgi:fumarylpyruvate hydrolase
MIQQLLPRPVPVSGRAVKEIGHPAKGAVWLRVNGKPRQEGDLIRTGTPKGVGRVEPGDRLAGHIDGVGDLSVSCDS